MVVVNHTHQQSRLLARGAMSSFKKAPARGSRRRHTIGSAADVSPTSKRLASNERRLEALKQRRKELTTHSRSLTIDADGKPGSSANKHIVFDSDEETERVSSGKQSLDLFDDGDDDNVNQFAARRQFEGASGEKLFRLQQQIGTDKRFRLDERFAVSSDEEGAGSDGEGVTSDDGMEEEKEQSRRILASLLGTSSSVVKKKPSAFPLVRRFDPSVASCADMEQEIKHDPEVEPTLSEDEELAEHTNSPPPVGKESYYKVSSHLKNLLTDREEKEEKQHTFNFFADEKDHVEDEVRASYPPVEEVGTVKTTRMTKSLDPIEDEECVSDGDTSRDHSKRLLFFFHSSDPLLSNRLEENMFYRSKTPEELIEKWTERRTAVKLAYKRSRKLALKRTKRTNW